MRSPGIEQAAALGLPTDIAGLRQRALEAYPFNPGYWVDVGNSLTDYNRSHPIPIDYGFIVDIWEIASSIRIEEAQASNWNLVRIRQTMDYIHREGADFYLQPAN